MEKEWTGADLIKYVNSPRFQETERDYVLKQILESEVLAKYLSTTEGRVIMGYVVDSIAANVMKIVSLASSGKDVKDIERAALDISLSYNFMYNLAKIAAKGQEHLDNMGK
jgi:hypothetical protein